MWLDKNVMILALSFLVFLCLSLGIVLLLIRLRNVDKERNGKERNVEGRNVEGRNGKEGNVETNGDNLRNVKGKESGNRNKKMKDDAHKNKTNKADNEHKPTKDAHKPTNNEHKPTSNEHKPTKDEHKPTKDEHKNNHPFVPTSSIDQPSETNNHVLFDEINKPIDNYREVLEGLDNEGFAITRGEIGNVFFIYSLQINDCPEEVFSSDSSNDLERESSADNLRKAIKSTLIQYISARTPGHVPSEESYIFPSTANLFLRLLYQEKDSFIVKRMDSTFMPLDAFQIVCKVIRGLIGYYGKTLSEINSRNVIISLYELEDKIRNFNSYSSLEELRSTPDLELITTFMTHFFTTDYLEFVQDVNKRKQDFKERKDYLINEWGLERDPILLEQSNPEMEYDFLDFVIYVCSRVLTSVISRKIY